MANLTAVIGADTSKFAEEISSAKYMLNKFINDTKQQSSAIKQNTQVTNEQISSYQRVIKSLEKVSSGTMTAKQQQTALTNQIKELKIQWANLSDSAKDGEFGKSLSSTLISAEDKLRTLTQQISQTNTEMNKLGKNSKFSNLSGINQSLGKLGMNLSGAAGAMNALGVQGGAALGNIASKSSMIASMGSTIANPYVLAGAAIVGAGVAWYKYNKEFENTMRITREFTGLEGPALESLRNGIKAVSDVWNKDYREVLSAVDNLMVQFHVDSETALDIVRSGFVAGADDAGKFLSMIQQYSGSFKDAGISASELVAIISQTRSGIFSEEGMAVIQMGAKNIRLMKDTTIEALNSIGVATDDMQKKLSDGTMTTMEALQEIAGKLSEFPPQSQEVGEVLQDVFGKKGSAAGYELVTALANIETDLDKVKGQTGEYGQALEDLADADKRLEAAMSETFSVTEGGFETIGAKAKTFLYEALIVLINEVNELKKSISLWYNYTKAAINQLSYSLSEFAAAWEALNDLDFDKVKQHLSNAFSLKKYNKEIDEYYDELQKKEKIYDDMKKKKGGNKKTHTPVISQNQNNTGNNTNHQTKNQNKLNDALSKMVSLYKEAEQISNSLASKDTFDKIEKDSEKAKNNITAAYLALIKFERAMKGQTAERPDVEIVSNPATEVEDEPMDWGAAIDVSDTEDSLNDIISKLQELQGQCELGGEEWKKYGDYIQEAQDKIDNASGNIIGIGESIQEVSSRFQEFGAGFSALGKAFKSPELNFAGVMMQAIASVMLAAGQAMQMYAGMGPWGWVLGIAQVLPTAMTMVAQMKQAASGFANGGIVSSGSLSGDQNFVRVNGQEMILNGTQQKHLFNILNGGYNSSSIQDKKNKVVFEIKGSKLRGVLRNDTKKFSRV